MQNTPKQLAHVVGEIGICNSSHLFKEPCQKEICKETRPYMMRKWLLVRTHLKKILRAHRLPPTDHRPINHPDEFTLVEKYFVFQNNALKTFAAPTNTNLLETCLTYSLRRFIKTRQESVQNQAQRKANCARTKRTHTRKNTRAQARAHTSRRANIIAHTNAPMQACSHM